MHLILAYKWEIGRRTLVGWKFSDKMAKSEFDHVLTLINLTGFGPGKFTCFSMLRMFWSVSICLVTLLLLVLELVHNFQGMETMIRTMEMLPVLIVVRNHSLIITDMSSKSVSLECHLRRKSIHLNISTGISCI